MARKRHPDEDILKLLREIDVHLASGSDVAAPYRAAGICDATYYTYLKKFGGMARCPVPPSRVSRVETQISNSPLLRSKI